MFAPRRATPLVDALVRVAVVASLAVGLGGATAGSSTHRLGPRSGLVVLDALGDSYTSQDSLQVWNAHACERAPTTYPSLVGAALRLAATNLACSGASSADLLRSVQAGAPAPQVKQVALAANLVTILIGLNDLGLPPYRFVNELAGCERFNETASTYERCQRLPGMSERALLSAVSSMSRNLVDALRWLRAHRPGAAVFVLDYPALVGTTACATPQYLRPGDLVAINTVMQRMRRALATDARADHAVFVDLYTPSLTAGGCPAWVAQGTATGDVLPNHPTQAGVKAMATTLEVPLSEYLLSHAPRVLARG